MPGNSASSQPGWITHQRQFWRGSNAGPGPGRVPAPVSPTGGDAGFGTGDNVSVDSQTYPFSIQAGQAPLLVVARQPTRKYLEIQNNSLASVLVYIGPLSQNVNNLAASITIPAGGSYTPRTGVPVDQIYVWTNGAAATGIVLTGT